MTTNFFQKRYDNLNNKQKEAVDTIFGPVLVIAGPGSGKTELLAVRIANILRETDASASNILCLTFTENAAINMRERLRKIIGQEAYKVAIHTFHSFGSEILNRYKYKLTDQSELTPIDDISASKIFDQIIGNLSWDNPWKNTANIFSLKSAIANLKNAGISEHDFEKILLSNEQILNHIWPIITERFSHIQSLGQKKVEKEQKVQIFRELTTEFEIILWDLPKYHGTQESLSETILTSMREIVESSDAKNITAWRYKWLEKDKNDNLILKDFEKNKKSFALLDIYKQYNAALKEKWLIDFSDMILSSKKILEENDDVRANIAEQYQWIMIDEYQDTNGAQLDLVKKITETTDFPNIFAVGDDDQSIYKFQWASTQNLKIFRDFFDSTKLIILEKNYRSHKEIIDFSREVISNQNAIIELFPGNEKFFDAHRGEGADIKKMVFDTELDEISWITDEVETIIENEKENPDFTLSDIAIITRKNATLENMGKSLLTRHIPVELSKDENIFENEVVILLKNILIYIHSLKHATDRDDILVEILSHPMWNLHRLDIWEISRQIYRSRKEENKSWIEVLKNNPNRNLSKIAHFLIELTILSQTKRLEDIIDIITGANELALSEEYLDEAEDREQFSLIINEEEVKFRSPIFEYYFSEERLKTKPLIYANYLANLRKLIDSIRAYKQQNPRLTLEDFVEYISLVEEYDIHLSTSTLIGSPDAVQCITGHKSKGLEYKYVFAIGLTKDNYIKTRYSGSPFPSNLKLEPEKDDTEDVERLIYTIFTRAKDSLMLTYSLKNISEKTTELVPTLGNITDFEKNEQKSIDNWTKILENVGKNILDFPFTGDEEVFLKKIVSTGFSISATALQNFLNIIDAGPEYFLSKNILQFPQAKSPSAAYGTAIHKGLEDFFKDFKQRKSFNKSILYTSFEKSLKKEGIDEKLEKTYLERGADTLEKLYEEIKKRDYHEIFLEFRFAGENGGTFLDDIKLSGAIDRIEATKDDTLIVTDYKTGGAITDLNITDSGTYENLKKWKYDLQLIFYALLFQNSPRWAPWKRHTYELLFVEPNKKTGEFTTVPKIVQHGEVERLKKLIIAVARHIKELNFPDTSHYTKDVAGIRQFEEDLINGVI